MRNVTSWYSSFLNQPVFLKNKFCNFKIHLFSIFSTRQTNNGIFSNKAGKNFNLAKLFLKVRVRLYLGSIISEVQNRVTHYDVTNRVTNSKICFFFLIFRVSNSIVDVKKTLIQF